MVILWNAWGAWATPSTNGTANIPVQDLLALHQERLPAPVAPPVAGVVNRLHLEGRVLDDALEVEVEVDASVLASTGWTALPLLQVDGRVALVDVPELSGAWLAVQGGTLTLLADQRGQHAFKLVATVQPVRRARERVAEIRVHPATSTQLQVGDIVIRPRQGVLTTSWEERAVEQAPTAVARAVREPSVERASTSLVSTLEGTWLVRTQYALQLQEPEDVTVRWPSDHRLERVYVNGVANAYTPERSELTLNVAPARRGGEEATVEVVLARPRSGYLLQGTLQVELPAISWPVADWTLTTHLPEVFNYAWEGGSMTLSDLSLDVTYADPLPTPGKATQWHQPLVVDSAPTLRLGYTVDLEGHYFRATTSP